VESPWGSGSLEGARARIDSRGWRGQKTYVIIEGPHVAIAQKLSSNSGAARKAAERFVSQVNSTAQRLGTVTSSGVDQLDSLDQLEKLGKLRDSGVISDEEFEAKKADLLKRL
jgi:Short C-terminal domain